MRQHVIVGAGLSGLVAAIDLAKAGRPVLVRERRARAGGETDIKGLEGKVISIGDGTPLDLARMRSYTGIDLGPVAVRLDEVRSHLYGRAIDIRFHHKAPAYLLERGPRPTSVDNHLYEMALAEGVEFSFNDTVTDFGELPPDSIIATGLFGEPFRELGVPHLPVYGYLAMAETEDTKPRVILYFDKYTRDYAFYSQVNGACGAVLFSRGKPLDPSVRERFERQLYENEGVSFDVWDTVNIGALPVKRPSNPRLFAGNLILAGTLSGAIEPLLLFGVHGALVTGKIAARAVDDHHGALLEFNRITSRFRLGYVISVAYRHAPVSLLKRAIWTGAGMYPHLAGIMGRHVYGLLPGFGRI